MLDHVIALSLYPDQLYFPVHPLFPDKFYYQLWPTENTPLGLERLAKHLLN